MVRHFAEFVVLMSRFSLFNLIENRYLWGKRPFIPPARSGAGIWPPLQRRPPRRELTLANFPRTLTPMTSQAQGFQAPARFAAKLNGDEKRAAQTFLCHRLAAFKHDAGMLPRLVESRVGSDWSSDVCSSDLVSSARPLRRQT